jgi:hypothetical protein
MESRVSLEELGSHGDAFLTAVGVDPRSKEGVTETWYRYTSLWCNPLARDLYRRHQDESLSPEEAERRVETSLYHKDGLPTLYDLSDRKDLFTWREARARGVDPDRVTMRMVSSSMQRSVHTAVDGEMGAPPTKVEEMEGAWVSPEKEREQQPTVVPKRHMMLMVILIVLVLVALVVMVWSIATYADNVPSWLRFSLLFLQVCLFGGVSIATIRAYSDMQDGFWGVPTPSDQIVSLLSGVLLGVFGVQAMAELLMFCLDQVSWPSGDMADAAI